MRITPLAIFLSKVENDDDLSVYVKAEVSLTHQVLVAKEAAVCYCIAIRSLLKDPSDRKKAFKCAQYAEKVNEHREWANKKGSDKIKGWLENIESDAEVRRKL